MADSTDSAAPPLQFVEGEADGYCDPVTGVCMLPRDRDDKRDGDQG